MATPMSIVLVLDSDY